MPSIEEKLDRILQLLEGDAIYLTSEDKHALRRVAHSIRTLKVKAAAIETDPPKPQQIQPFKEIKL